MAQLTSVLIDYGLKGGRLPALPTNITLGWKLLKGANPPAYYITELIVLGWK
jgi:hypothetical protein